MRHFLIALFSGLIIATAADAFLYGGVNTVVPAKIAGTSAVNQFHYQVSLLLSKLP
jgi:hypothetical protein